jgi:hypothetical protein
MTDDLVKRLRYLAKDIEAYESKTMLEAADRIDELEELLIDISCDCQHFCEYDWVMEHCPHKKAAMKMENR